MRKKLKRLFWIAIIGLVGFGSWKAGEAHQRDSDAYLQAQLDECLGAMADYKVIADDARDDLAQQTSLMAQKDNRLAFMNLTNDKLTAENEELKAALSESLNSSTATFTATAYTLRSSAAGITSTGYDLNGKDVTERIISVDPSVIPLHSKVYISFPAPFDSMSGWYQAEDTGAAVKGTRIDIFFGDRDDAAYQAAMNFGVRQVEVICVIPPAK